MALPCPSNQSFYDGIGCVPDDPVDFVKKFYAIGLGLIGSVAVLFIIYSGYLIMFSGGDPDRLSDGKRYLVYSLIGLFLAIFGFLFFTVIAKDILHIPGIG